MVGLAVGRGVAGHESRARLALARVLPEARSTRGARTCRRGCSSIARGITHRVRAPRGRAGRSRHAEPRDRRDAVRDLKTVEVHLGRSYAKLNIKSRSQLPAALGTA